MAEAIGPISGSITLVKLFHVTIQVFDIVNTSRTYSSEIHILCSQLQIERVRLISWGELIGLTEIHGIGPQVKLDDRIYQPQCCHAIAHHLNRLLELLQKVDKFFNKHGVQLDQNHNDDDKSSENDDASTSTARPSNKQVLSTSQASVQHVFHSQLETIRKSIQVHQTTLHWFKKAKWAIYQGDRFRGVVDEIRGLVDGLPNILPDVRTQAKEQMTREIEISEDVRSLDMVQAATFEHHQELAEAASMRSESLSISMSARYTIADRSTAGPYRSLPNRTRRTNEAELASSEAIMSPYSRGAALAFYHQRKDSVLLPCSIR